MNKKLSIALLMLAMLISLLGSACGGSEVQATLASEEATSTAEMRTIYASASLAGKTIDDLIIESTLIVIGELATVYPSRWNTPDGKFPTDPWIEDLLDAFPDYTIYTEVDILVTRVLKGEMRGKTVRVRTFGGQVEQIRLIIEGQPSVVGQVSVRPDREDYPSFEFDHTYLLFLRPDTGRDIGADHLILTGAIQGMFTISEGRAISIRDEFPLDELLASIQEKAMWTATPTATFPPVRLAVHLTEELIDNVSEYIEHGQVNNLLQDGLLDKLNAADMCLYKGEFISAIQELEAFVREVQAQRGQGIEEATADDLITQAQAIIAALSPALTPTPTETPTNPPPTATPTP